MSAAGETPGAAESQSREDHVRDSGQLLPAIIEVLAKSSDPRMVLGSVIGLILKATQADACFLHRWDPEKRMLHLVAANDRFRHMVGRVSLAENEGVAGWVARHRRAVVIEKDKWSDPRYKYIPELGGDSFTSMVSVPVTSGRGGLIGVLNLHTVDELHFGQRELEFISATAALVGTALDNSDLLTQLIDKEAQLEALVKSTLETQETERTRAAREIHDGVIQLLVAIEYRLHTALDPDSEDRETSIRTALDMTGQAIEEARRAVRDLRPPVLEDLGLIPGLEQLAARIDDAGELTVEIRAPDELNPAPATSLVLFRVAQESLVNAAKHAQARTATVVLDADADEISMVVTDDGLGFDVKEAMQVREGATYG
ncbi:MAG TPA: GAF domain-containing sensor histidine kinase, partial [Acidimicrobiia bacterium]|nr:GAF domain-containing sensor histidine kinase [Acidimicrobiia bacterium]